MGTYYIVLVFFFVFFELSRAQMKPVFINCGANGSLSVGRRTWVRDLSAQNLTISFPGAISSTDSIPGNSLYGALYNSARVFNGSSNYTFNLISGRYLLRLHFYPFSVLSPNVNDSLFDVTANDVKLLSQLSVSTEIARRNSFIQAASANSSIHLIKEYILGVDSERLVVSFTPIKNSIAFVNAMELLPVSGSLFDTSVGRVNDKGGNFSLLNRELETMYRLNVGDSETEPSSDRDLWRTWEPDFLFMYNVDASSIVHNRSNISYGPAETSLIAPLPVYSAGRTMTDPEVLERRFNMSWKFGVDPGFEYLIRLHFCELVFDKANQRVFRIYINNQSASNNFDIIANAGEQDKTYHQDFVDSMSQDQDSLWIQLGPANGLGEPDADALLNGLEIFKISRSSNLAYVPEQAHSSDEKNTAKPKVILWGSIFGIFGLITSLSAMAFFYCKKKDKNVLVKKQTTSWWLLFVNGAASPMNALSSQAPDLANGSMATTRVGRRFTFGEIRAATNNFDESLVIGNGGFGKVFKGVIDDGSLVAIKRAHPQSEQGLREFETEIEMLSKLRHRHLVSLIGYCKEKSEMVLVYEYMAHGTLRGHLFGSDLPPLSWKQRLDACIGAARGLHYLHTGAEGGIIHRDVKTTNILLDENFVAKVSDFGLSKTGPSIDKTHVSTAVKGSFGYLDPEYFRKQQLTAKSDVYSFGVVLFEIVCARPVINPSLPRDQINLAEWAIKWQRQGSLEKIVDPKLNGAYSLDSLIKIGEIAEKCLADEGKKRPTMGEVLWHLEYVLQLHEASTKQNDGLSFTTNEQSVHINISNQDLVQSHRPQGTNDDTEASIKDAVRSLTNISS